MKKIVIAKIEVKPGKEKDFMALALPLVESTRAEPGNRVYRLYQDTEKCSQYLVYEEYTDEEAFQAHGATAHFQSFAQQVQPLLAAELDIQVF